MLGYLVSPNKQFVTKDGAPMTAGHLEVFLYETDDRATTYRDFNGTLNPADIAIDANGRASVIADYGTTYRIEVYDASGALQWTVSPAFAGGGGTGTSNVSVYYCTQPSWPSASDMYADFEYGRDIVIIRQSFSGESYNVWNLAEAVKRTIAPVSYKMTFVNDTGDRVNKIVFASTDKRSWTETESSVVIPHRQTIAPSWDSLDTSNYHKNTLVYKGDTLYKCKVDNPSSTWTPSEWEETNVADELLRIETGDGDKLWAHWENEGNWHDISSGGTFPNSDYVKSEGELTDSQYPYLKAGLYRFTMEVALRNYPSVYDAIEKCDISVNYGSQSLREQSFLFDRTIPVGSGVEGTFAETVWFGGIFRMPAEGEVSVSVARRGYYTIASMKCSHIFINKIGD